MIRPTPSTTHTPGRLSHPFPKVLGFIALCLVSTSLWSQVRKIIPSRESDTVAWYLVKDGDTLSSITYEFLGESTLWPENHRLNPHVKDPNLLIINDRLRIIITRQLPQSKAEIEKVVRKVMRRTPKRSWLLAKQGDILVEKNEVQTFKRASTRLRFEDGAHLDIKEESLIFLRRVGQSLRGIERQSIEIKKGEADFAQMGIRKKQSHIEIIVGDMLARPQPDAAGLLATRTRKAENGNAQVMVYDGETEVDAAGSKVSVPRGMGTIVEPGKPPKPPQKLLAATRLNSPGKGGSFAYANPLFSWSAIKDAASYTFELCNDPECATPTFRQTNITATSYQSQTLSRGDYYWRVTAVSVESLDGFPAKARLLSIHGDRPDLLAPVLIALPVGAGRVEAPNRMILGPGGTIRIIAQDDAAGIASIQYRWNQAAWKPYDGKDLALPGEPESAILEAQATDNLGKTSALLSVHVTFDKQLPRPPAIKKDP